MPRVDINLDQPVSRAHLKRDSFLALGHSKRRTLMLARKQPAACQMVHERPGVAAGDVDTLMSAVLVLPDDGDAVSGILARQSQRRWKSRWPDVLQTNQAHSGDGTAFVQFRREWRRQQTPHDD